MEKRTPEQTDNLLRLADGLEKVAYEYPQHFDMGYFISYGNEEPVDDILDRHRSGEHPRDCGTVACAIGWAPYILGIPYTYTEFLFWDKYSTDVFGTDYKQYTYLFLDFNADEETGKDAALAVADKIRKFVEDTD